MPQGNGRRSFGKGPGFGRGMRRGLGGGWPPLGEQSLPVSPNISNEQGPAQRGSSPAFELEVLKRQSHALRQQIDGIQRRIDELTARQGKKLAQRTKLIAEVDEETCTGCGMCAEVCPQAAIKINTIAQVDAERCTGCGICVQHCQNRALVLVP